MGVTADSEANRRLRRALKREIERVNAQMHEARKAGDRRLMDALACRLASKEQRLQRTYSSQRVYENTAIKVMI